MQTTNVWIKLKTILDGIEFRTIILRNEVNKC